MGDYKVKFTTADKEYECYFCFRKIKVGDEILVNYDGEIAHSNCYSGPDVDRIIEEGANGKIL